MTQAEQPVVVLPVLRSPVPLRYPSEAAGLHGDVRVRVQLDVQGVVTGVEVISGPLVFHEAAVEAAETLGFVPATVGGVAVPSSALVDFHFAPPEAVVDDHEVEEIVVQASPEVEGVLSVTVLSDAQLARSASADLARTVAQVPGVVAARGTADAAKPVIRGQVERRLLLRVDGVRHESQKWGPDHAPEIDPFAAGAITVIKGASGVRYGPDAIGGVVLVEPPPMRTTPGVGGLARLVGGTNAARGYGALRLDAGLPDGWSLRAEGSFLRAAAQRAPDYALGNTGQLVGNGGLSVQVQRPTWRLRATWHHHHLTAGVFYGVRVGTPAEFQEQLGLQRPASADVWTADGAIDRPYQAVDHDIATLHADGRAGGWRWEAVYAAQVNHRREFEQVRGSVSGAQYDFRLTTHSLDAVVRHPSVRVGSGDLTGSAGITGSIQENVYEGLTLLPNHRAFGAGLFVVEGIRWPRGSVEIGARVDHLQRAAWLSELEFERHERRGTLAVGDCDAGERVRCARNFTGGSFSIGGSAQLVRDVLELKVDLSSATRFPNPDELYLLGNAPTFPVYAVSDPSLGPETTWGASPTLGLNLPWVTGEVSAYVNHIDDYIYFAPELGADGLPRLDVTIRGAFPTFTYRAIDALFYGVDGAVDLGPEAIVGARLSGAVVRAKEVGGAGLVGTPADRGEVTGIVRGDRLGPLRDAFVSVSTGFVARQTRVDPAADFAPAPDAYALLGLSVGAELPLRQHRSLRFGVEANNLLNTAYREYTSLLRYYADQPGVDVRAHASLVF